MAYHDEKGRITIDEQAAAKDVKRLQESVEVLKRSRAAIDVLSKEYYMQGAVAFAIVNKAEQTKRDLSDMIAKLEETISFIQKTVRHYQLLDEQIKQAIQAAANAAAAAASTAGINASNSGSAAQTGSSGASHGGSGRHDSGTGTASKPAAEDVLKNIGSAMSDALENLLKKK